MRVFLVVLNICLAMSEGDEDLVVELTDLTFTSTVSDTRYLMVEFYAPWCGHCQSFYPQYSQAAKTLRKLDMGLTNIYEYLKSKIFWSKSCELILSRIAVRP